MATLELTVEPLEPRLRNCTHMIWGQNSTAFLVRSQLHRPSSQPPSSQDLARALFHLRNSDWQDLTALWYSGSQLTCDAAAWLAALNLPSLTRLAIRVPTLDAAVMATLLRGQWSSLDTIYLELEGFDAEALAQLTQRHWPSLRNLSLASCNCCHVCDIALMPTCVSWPNLFVMSMHHVRLNVESFVKIRQVCHANLKRLSICSAGLSTGYLQALNPLPCLVMLELPWNGLGADEVAVLVKADIPQLTELHLNDNQLDAAAMKLMATGRWPNLQEIYLHRNAINTVGINFLTTADWPSLHLVTVDIAACTELHAAFCLLAELSSGLLRDKTRKYRFGTTTILGELHHASWHSVWLQKPRTSSWTLKEDFISECAQLVSDTKACNGTVHAVVLALALAGIGFAYVMFVRIKRLFRFNG